MLTQTPMTADRVASTALDTGPSLPVAPAHTESDTDIDATTITATATDAVQCHALVPARLTLRDGMLTGIPIWAGAVPVGIVYAVLSLDAGYSWLQTQLMSLLIYSGAAQLTMVTLREEGAGGLAILFMAVVLGLRHVLYSMTIRPHLQPGERPPAAALSMFVTDEAYGLSSRAWQEGRGSARYLAGIGLTMYAGWSGGTALGLLFGSLLPDLDRLGVELIFPLLFVVLLLPLLRGRWHITVAVVGGALAYIGNQVGLPGGVTIFLAMIGGCTVGALLPRSQHPTAASGTTSTATPTAATHEGELA